MHVFDEWRHLGTVGEDDCDGACEWPAAGRGEAFDLDVYRILCRQLRRPRDVRWVRLGARAGIARPSSDGSHASPQADEGGAFELQRVLEP
jgi:hypothetical protein